MEDMSCCRFDEAGQLEGSSWMAHGKFTWIATLVVFVFGAGCANDLGGSGVGLTAEGEFETWVGAVTESSADEPYDTGSASALYLRGPDADGQYVGEWQQPGLAHVWVRAVETDNGLRIVGQELVVNCRRDSAGSLLCLIHRPSGNAIAEMHLSSWPVPPGELPRDPNRPSFGCPGGFHVCHSFCCPAGELCSHEGCYVDAPAIL